MRLCRGPGGSSGGSARLTAGLGFQPDLITPRVDFYEYQKNYDAHRQYYDNDVSSIHVRHLIAMEKFAPGTKPVARRELIRACLVSWDGSCRRRTAGLDRAASRIAPQNPRQLCQGAPKVERMGADFAQHGKQPGNSPRFAAEPGLVAGYERGVFKTAALLDYGF